MKHLTVVRHAKSSWKEPELADFDRPLNERGLRDAPRMAQRLGERRPAPDRILTSPAARALATAVAFAEALDYEPDSIDRREELYLAAPESLLEVVRAFDPAWSRVILVGHNPGVSELVNALAGAGIDDLPTCAVAELELRVGSWEVVTRGSGRLVELDYPKKD